MNAWDKWPATAQWQARLLASPLSSVCCSGHVLRVDVDEVQSRYRVIITQDRSPSRTAPARPNWLNEISQSYLCIGQDRKAASLVPLQGNHPCEGGSKW